MLSSIIDKAVIQSAQASFESIFKNHCKNDSVVTVGFPSGNKKIRVWWSIELDIWGGFEVFDKYFSRYWNVFGIGIPNLKGSNSITCEINFPKEGLDRRISGGLAKDSLNQVYIFHRGVFRGGVQGRNKELFSNTYSGHFEDIDDAGQKLRVAPVGCINNPEFLDQLSTFVHEIGRFKSIDPKIATIVSEDSSVIFKDEYTGKKRYQISIDVVADCQHGRVVKALKNEISAYLKESNFKVANDINRDLYISDTNLTVKMLFEVKSSAVTTKFYEAIGQLFYHSAATKKKPVLVAVFPNNLKSIPNKTLENLGIRVLLFDWKGKLPYFIGLAKVLKTII